MRPGRVICALLFVAPVVAGSSPAGASHSWGGYHWWSGAGAVTVSLGDNVSGVWDGLLTTVDVQWDTTYVNVATVAGGSDAACAPTAGKVEVCNGEYGQNGWLGLATIWLDGGGHIQQGRVQVNDSYFLTPSYDSDTARLHVLCQEVGHTIGLDHQKKPQAKSCMNDAWGLFSTDYDQPNQHDYDQLNSIYSHDDAAPGGGGGGGLCANNPNHWKCSGGQSEHVSVTHLPDGGHVVTWVTPA